MDDWKEPGIASACPGGGLGAWAAGPDWLLIRASSGTNPSPSALSQTDGLAEAAARTLSLPSLVSRLLRRVCHCDSASRACCATCGCEGPLLSLAHWQAAACHDN